jgi:hypothetical protein
VAALKVIAPTLDKTTAAPEKIAPTLDKTTAAPEKIAPTLDKTTAAPEKIAPTLDKTTAAPEKIVTAAVAAAPVEIVAVMEPEEIASVIVAPEEIAAAPVEIASVIAAPEEIASVIAAPEEIASIIAAPEEIAAAVVSRASIADVVYDDDRKCFMFKNVDAINDSEYLLAADLQKVTRGAVKTATKTSEKIRKRCWTTMDSESSGILGVDMRNKKRCFLVHWTSGIKSWEPIENVSNLIGVMNYMSSSHNEVIHVE